MINGNVHLETGKTKYCMYAIVILNRIFNVKHHLHEDSLFTRVTNWKKEYRCVGGKGLKNISSLNSSPTADATKRMIIPNVKT